MKRPKLQGMLRIGWFGFLLFWPSDSHAQSSLAHSNSPLRIAENLDSSKAGTEASDRELKSDRIGIFDPIQESLRLNFQADPDRQAEDPQIRIDAIETEVGSLADLLQGDTSSWTSRRGLGGTLQILLLVSVLSLAPAVLLMTTCYVRVIVVLGLLRQALGTGQLPPTQVLTSISLFITLFVMTPVWNRIYRDSIQPYTAPESEMSLQEAWQAAAAPVRDFMSRQIDLVGNQDDVHLFYRYHVGPGTTATSYEEVPLQVLLPAYMLSELKTAFLMGFMIYLPFLVIDLVVAAVTISMGMMMLPPAMISLPFKLLLFVLVDGWHLIVGMLLQSFGAVA